MKGAKGKTILIILSAMILWDFSLHLQELLGIAHYLIFSSREIYTSFWSIYWGVAFVLSLILFKKIKWRKNGK